MFGLQQQLIILTIYYCILLRPICSFSPFDDVNCVTYNCLHSSRKHMKHGKKNVKSHVFLDFEKNVKNVKT